MPLGPGVRYRVSRRGGQKIRLAFRGNTVVEAKNLDTGATSDIDAKARRHVKARHALHTGKR